MVTQEDEVGLAGIGGDPCLWRPQGDANLYRCQPQVFCLVR